MARLTWVLRRRGVSGQAGVTRRVSWAVIGVGDMAVSGVDKAGRDCAERRPVPDWGGHGLASYPVIDADHRWAMIAELYQSGWSYWLIAQFCGMDPKACREALFTGGASMGARQ